MLCRHRKATSSLLCCAVNIPGDANTPSFQNLSSIQQLHYRLRHRIVLCKTSAYSSSLLGRKTSEAIAVCSRSNSAVSHCVPTVELANLMIRVSSIARTQSVGKPIGLRSGNSVAQTSGRSDTRRPSDTARQFFGASSSFNHSSLKGS